MATSADILSMSLSAMFKLGLQVWLVDVLRLPLPGTGS